jgi:hypothetical protein
MKIILALVFAFFLIATQAMVVDNGIDGIEFLPNFLPKFAPQKYCPTEDVFRWKQAIERMKGSNDSSLAACAPQGNCDQLGTRNGYRGRQLRIPLYITVLCQTTTSSCAGGVTQSRVNDQVNQINSDFTGTGIQFTVASTRFVVDSTYWQLAAYSQTNSLWYTQLVALKNKHAVSPNLYLNVFVTAQASGTQGTLLGIGTFPWDTASNGNTGGLWVNANYVRAGDKTASHEIGHNVGLWHTFHGDSEVSCSSTCYETVHSDVGDTTVSNDVGDYCADTPAQPMNYNCVNPTGSDCKGNRYTLYSTANLTNNIMAYTPDSCMQLFSPQQTMRALCWVCNSRVSTWVSGQC